MKWMFLYIFFILTLVAGTWYVFRSQSRSVISPMVQLIERPLDKYTIDNLTRRQGIPSQIILDEAVSTTSAYTEYIFQYMSDEKRVTGFAHVPTRPEPTEGFPVIVQLRGYVEKEKYRPGVGTKRSAEVFARNGYISLAPDFLGYGRSDAPSSDVFEERFQTYTATLDLLASIPSLPIADPAKVGIWGHSNGGQIALTVLEITGKPYPTTLWAPVTKPFPYSILYYTDEADDRGKALRRKLSDFEKSYDVDLYAMTNYVDRIAAPLQLHQGTADDAVPLKWNEEFVTVQKEKKKTIGYFVYSDADHNMQPRWNTVITRDIEFFRQHFTTAVGR